MPASGDICREDLGVEVADADREGLGGGENTKFVTGSLAALGEASRRARGGHDAPRGGDFVHRRRGPSPVGAALWLRRERRGRRFSRRERQGSAPRRARLCRENGVLLPRNAEDTWRLSRRAAATPESGLPRRRRAACRSPRLDCSSSRHRRRTRTWNPRCLATRRETSPPSQLAPAPGLAPGPAPASARTRATARSRASRSRWTRLCLTRQRRRVRQKIVPVLVHVAVGFRARGRRADPRRRAGGVCLPKRVIRRRRKIAGVTVPDWPSRSPLVCRAPDILPMMPSNRLCFAASASRRLCSNAGNRTREARSASAGDGSGHPRAPTPPRRASAGTSSRGEGGSRSTA